MTPRLKKLLLLQPGGWLPQGYTELEYLESSGTQYILIPEELSFGNYNGVQVEYEYPADRAKPSGHVLGVHDERTSEDINSSGSPFHSCIGWWMKDAGPYVGAFNAYGPGALVPWVPGERIIASFKYKYTSGNKIWRVSHAGQKAQDNCWGISSLAQTPLFAIMKRWSLTLTSLTIGRIYKVEFTYKTDISRDIIPILDENGTPCMFDKISKQPFYNAGSGDFIAGLTLRQARELRLPSGGGSLTLSLPYEASVDAASQAALERARAAGWTLTLQYREGVLPAGYRKLEFLESSGTQYIDTSFFLTNSHEIEVVCQTIGGTPNTSPLFGAKEYALTVYIHQDLFAWFFWGTESSEVRGTPKFDKQTITAKGGKLYSDGVLVKNYSDQVFEASNTCWVFNINGRGSSGAYIGTIFEFVVKKQDATKLHLIPVLDANGTPCMFDTVTSTPFYNSGTGAFIAGLATIDDVRTLYLAPTGGSITLSVPAETPQGYIAALQRNNPNWTISIQYRES